MPDLPPEAYDDQFHPPSIPTEVFCLHCQRTYESYLIEWREREVGKKEGGLPGFWCCPTPGCSGAGFGFDIHPVDPEYIDPDGRDMGQWVDDEEGCGSDDEDCDCFDCRWARGEIDPDNMTDDELKELQESVRAHEADGDEDCELCACGGGEDFQIDDDANTIPLDDLLPASGREEDEIDINWELMMEIEEKLGFREPSREREDASSQSPLPRLGHPPITEDDIPF